MRLKKFLPTLLISTTLLLAACNKSESTSTSTSSSTTESSVTALALEKTNDLYGDYKEEDYTVATSGDTTITFKDSTADISGSGASLKDTTLSITKGGTYELTGEFSGTITIDSIEEVTLILNGVTLTNETGPAINIVEAKKVIITLAEGSNNSVSDGENYAATDTDDPTSAIYSKADLTFNGTGNLSVTGNYNNAIQSKDDLTFISGTYTVTAVNNALKGKDKVAILAGDYTLETKSGDAIQVTNDTEEEKGFVAIDGGNLSIQSGSDGIQAQTALYLQNATMEITTENTSNTTDISLKGLKAGNNLLIDSGTYTINSADDTIHSNGDLTINNGDFSLSAVDDALHAEYNLTLNDGTINILSSEEGIEGEAIVLNGGDINVAANDDGINASAASESTSTSTEENQGEMPEGQTPPEGEMSEGQVPEKPTGEMPQGMTPFDQKDTTTETEDVTTSDSASTNTNQQKQNTGKMPGGAGGMMDNDGSTLEINGGNIVVNAQGDGLDSNGDITMTGGNVLVYGPENSGNGTLDYAGSFTLSGGTLLAAGSAGMAQAVSEESTQVNLAFYLDEMTTANTVTISQNEKVLYEFNPSKTFQQIVFSSAELTTGEVSVTIDDTTYTLTLSDTYNSLAQDDSEYAGGMDIGMSGGRNGGQFQRPGDETTDEENTNSNTEISGDTAV